MPSEACRYGAIACLDFDENNIPTFSEKYVKIDMKGYPTVVEDSAIPYSYRFENLNQHLVKEDNSEPYHREARQGYLWRSPRRPHAGQRGVLFQALFRPFGEEDLLGAGGRRARNRRRDDRGADCQAARHRRGENACRY